ncbi:MULTISPECIES: hypothetical protein [Chryseobacterium]|jgi:hypothetical protein|uniref:Uncharacterized protein n=1 Tax=Chryseobacterium rhizosphaerae TaxID=395937 RepID=A0AAE3Y4N0_9FLAO|nr:MULTISPECIES: hypothetical protein [Chryseobacterium]MDC8100051.1 hypothetical protein [Chryseobacterium rhizosphaerae]MDR6524875.1 hypothetical protein [Chryseobacterium rhizosphaerae]MDR6546940.1 hypothetical protein [Chryseobacterium rhizosphaerae]REC73553.1 hypothetical protein DRF57_16745 [Chryseobacterium rhizosphaerae]SMC33676.1 hypothetical protein SAMN02787074_0416 [Chryseobacterium sp. YR221]
MANFSEYLPYAFALIIAIPFLVLLRQFVHSYITLKNQEIKLLSVKSNTENKAHSYERMTLFLERLKPSNLIQKFDKELAVHEFLFLTEKTINEEFEYNSSQQLYLSKNSWKNIVDSKNAVIELLHKTYEGLNGNADLNEFKTIFIMNYMEDNDYIAATIEDLRKEILIIT